jgi:hypothetical protein
MTDTAKPDLLTELNSLFRLSFADALKSASSTAKPLYLNKLRSALEFLSVPVLLNILFNAETPAELRGLVDEHLAGLNADKDSRQLLENSMRSFVREYSEMLIEKNSAKKP